MLKQKSLNVFLIFLYFLCNLTEYFSVCNCFAYSTQFAVILKSFTVRSIVKLPFYEPVFA